MLFISNVSEYKSNEKKCQHIFKKKTLWNFMKIAVPSGTAIKLLTESGLLDGVDLSEVVSEDFVKLSAFL
ncbi:MAG: hypothetical protein SOZ46_08405, partial [Bullifex sp.]|nr:hypothetical protein [Bullifex sp.]